MEYLVFWVVRFQCKSESRCVWPHVQHTEPDDGSLPSTCVTAQFCVTHSCLVVFIRVPPQATGWQLCSSYKKKKRSNPTPSHQYTPATPSYLTPQNREEDWETACGDGREGIYRHIVQGVETTIREFKVGSPFVFRTAPLDFCQMSP